jgi:hypothetical protein
MTRASFHMAGSLPGTSSGPVGRAPVEPTSGPQAAQVRVVVPLSREQEARLEAHLQRLVGRPVSLQVSLDPTILGGVWVRMDDLVIDGTVRARLDALHEHMCVRCRMPQGAGPTASVNAR